MLAQNLAFVNVNTRIDVKTPAILQFIDSECSGLAGIHRYQYAIKAARNAALPWLVRLKTVCHDSLAGGSGEHIIAQANDTSCRDVELQMLQVAFGLHHQQLAFALGNQFYHLSRYFGGNIYD